MECIHLSENVKITAPPMKDENPPCQFHCSVCKTSKSPWLCLTCGAVHCGRYVNAHAKLHYEERQKHSVCMDCDSYAAFCYACDEFVINDTDSGDLDKLRKHLRSVAKFHTVKNRRRDSLDSTENEGKKKKIKTDTGAKAIKPRTSGLRNLGNTCFMNAVLQSLSNIQQFCGYIKQLPSLEKKKPRANVTRYRNGRDDDILLVEELRKTLIQLWQGNKSAISPESLFSVIWKVVPRFRGYQQQDAHEFMRYLLDRLHTELLTLLPYPNPSSPYIGPKGKSTIVTAIFGGLLQNEVNCLICGTDSKKHDPFLDLSLDIPDCKEGLVNLSECLSHFTEVEELEESELYNCGTCKRKQRSTKQFWIRRLPNVLCLHIKRFRWSSHYRVKLETLVNFPIHGLDMNEYVLNNMHETRNSCSGSNLYDLAAVVVHHGSGAGSGHYTAYAYHDSRWYHFNDSNVSVCEEETVAKCKAYILFYVRRELKLPDFLVNIGSNGEETTKEDQ
ncbi:ubiquitin carboxyl-terminal hydrolase 3-like [Lingula anatina]|uniref:Ubiquitin carboxyl-terminal hydrolase n=1 Tax=Lingula anatina TaxID=7574 RepID=A0A1S3H889_LINAN|nr:ubiquitin carboxyl-terminal hydrolase 3 [Lingula anatina]XP_013385146.1 ubiquitin carboxyl-terminal hydrolase 3-like [Lingula anatina]|eukprot:XP_013382197.1 ubiquitin carboxyl-terminal hydrolase 3 [Lingula anatina]